MYPISRASHSLQSCRGRVGWLMLATQLLAVLAFCAPPALAQEGRSELVLTNLPPRNSKAYKDLIGLAGKTANGQILGLSQSEVWSMPTPLIEGVIRRGETMGVKMTRLGADWNEILKPPSAPMPMSGSQESMMKAMESSKETMSVGMMATPNAAVVEYALMKDSDAKSAIGSRPAGQIEKIMIPLKDKGTITVRRTSVEMRKDGCNWRGEIEGTGEPVVLMWWKGGRFSGMFTYRGHMYSLKNMGGEVHAVVETDPGKMPPDHGSMRAGGAQPTSADVKDDPLVARGEAAMMRPRDKSKLKDQQDAFGGQALPKTERSQQAKQAAPKIVPLPAAKRRPRRPPSISWCSIPARWPRNTSRFARISSPYRSSRQTSLLPTAALATSPSVSCTMSRSTTTNRTASISTTFTGWSTARACSPR